MPLTGVATFRLDVARPGGLDVATRPRIERADAVRCRMVHEIFSCGCSVVQRPASEAGGAIGAAGPGFQVERLVAVR